jgi:hypothetical protein
VSLLVVYDEETTGKVERMTRNSKVERSEDTDLVCHKFVYYESMKRKLKIKPCLYMSVGVMEDYKLRDLRASLSHTGLVVELEHLKIKTRLTNEKFASVKGECAI